MRLRAPKPGTAFCQHHGRLALFHQEAEGAAYWKDYWTPQRREALLGKNRAGSLGELDAPIEEWVPRDRPAVEAGCGPAHVVAALSARGYTITGVDYEPEVVSFVKAELPGLDVRLANINALPFPDASLGSYLSFGVVEHIEEGPDAALREARRVLHPDGVALISVPFLNPPRAAELEVTTSSPPADRTFHQYYFGLEDFSALLDRAGLRTVATVPYAVEAFLIREHPIAHRLWKTPIARQRVKRVFRRAFTTAPISLRRRYAHMMLFVAKPGAAG